MENIKEREVMFNEMLAAKSLLSPARKPVAIKRSIKAKAKTILPPRKSARIAGEEVLILVLIYFLFFNIKIFMDYEKYLACSNSGQRPFQALELRSFIEVPILDPF